MHQRTIVNGEPLLGDKRQGAGRYGMGLTYFDKWATSIGAKVKFGPHLVRYNFAICDAELDRMSGSNKERG